MAGPEARLVTGIRGAVVSKWPDAWSLKVHGSPYQPAGTPDILLCILGRLVAVEVKAPRPGESRSGTLARVTPAQRRELARIEKAGGIALVGISIPQVIADIEAAL